MTGSVKEAVLAHHHLSCHQQELCSNQCSCLLFRRRRHHLCCKAAQTCLLKFDAISDVSKTQSKRSLVSRSLQSSPTRKMTTGTNVTNPMAAAKEILLPHFRLPSFRVDPVAASSAALERNLHHGFQTSRKNQLSCSALQQSTREGARHWP